MPISSFKTLVEAGVHFGHRASRWNPKMAVFIHSKRNLVHIIDLKETLRGLVRARHFLMSVAAGGGKILFVGTKRQAKAIVEKIAKDCVMPGVSERWLGGMLTNHATIRSRLARLEEIELMEKTGEIERYSKKMISALMREKRKLIRNLDGIRTLNRMPAALVVVDPRHEEIAVKEARKLGIPVVALIDTDSDPKLIDIPIPCNDDAMRSIQMLLADLGEAVMEGVQKYAAGAGERAKARKETAVAAPAPGKREAGRKPARKQRPRRPTRGGPGGPRPGMKGKPAPRGKTASTAPAKAAETPADPSKPKQAKPEQAKPEQVKPEQAKPEQAKPEPQAAGKHTVPAPETKSEQPVSSPDTGSTTQTAAPVTEAKPETSPPASDAEDKHTVEEKSKTE